MSRAGQGETWGEAIAALARLAATEVKLAAARNPERGTAKADAAPSLRF